MFECDLRLNTAEIEIVEVDKVAELDGDPLGAREPRLVQSKFELPVEF